MCKRQKTNAQADLGDRVDDELVVLQGGLDIAVDARAAGHNAPVGQHLELRRVGLSATDTWRVQGQQRMASKLMSEQARTFCAMAAGWQVAGIVVRIEQLARLAQSNFSQQHHACRVLPENTHKPRCEQQTRSGTVNARRSVAVVGALGAHVGEIHALAKHVARHRGCSQSKSKARQAMGAKERKTATAMSKEVKKAGRRGTPSGGAMRRPVDKMPTLHHECRSDSKRGSETKRGCGRT